MAFSKNNAAVATPAPAAEAAAPVAAQVVPAEVLAKAAAPIRTAQGSEDKKVKGQVAMHAIIAGYNTASRLVLTLAPKPTESEDLLHTLAAKIAAKIEAYSFHE